MLFPENIGERLAIDESSLSNGELYTFVTNRYAKTREGSLVAVVAGTKSEDVIAVLERIDEDRLNQVKEVTLDLSDSMRRIIINVFPKAQRVIDRFHIQKLANDALQDMRIAHRWEAIQQANDEMEEAKLCGEQYEPFRFPTETHARNFWYVHVTCSSNTPTNGQKDRKSGLQYFLKNLRT